MFSPTLVEDGDQPWATSSHYQAPLVLVLVMVLVGMGMAGGGDIAFLC